jgi:hypothetical protein
VANETIIVVIGSSSASSSSSSRAHGSQSFGHMPFDLNTSFTNLTTLQLLQSLHQRT